LVACVGEFLRCRAQGGGGRRLGEGAGGRQAHAEAGSGEEGALAEEVLGWVHAVS
jgi:hypothetical protein